MSNSVMEDLIHLVKRVGSSLAQNTSNIFTFLFYQQKTHSVWALAGFAAAVVFAWRLMRAPDRHQRSPKHPNIAGAASMTTSDVTELASESCSPYDDPKMKGEVEFLQPSKPTLGQIVRQKLGEGRKVTCRLVGVVFEEGCSEDLRRQATIRTSALQVLLEITKCCDLYLMETVVDDESEERILQALDKAGLFMSGSLVKEKVLFCSTEDGRKSFVRQLESDWHIDSSSDIVLSLARFIKYQLYISPNSPKHMASNVLTSETLEEFFGISIENQS